MDKIKNSFVLYTKYEEALRSLTNEEMGQLFRAIFTYEKTGSVSNLSAAVLLSFNFIRQDLDENCEKWVKKCENNKANGYKGGRPKTQSNQTDKDKTKRLEEKPKKPDNDNDNDYDNDNDNDYDNECVSNDTHNSARGEKHKFGKYKNVLLTQKEYDRLIAEPDGTEAIEYFSDYRERKGYKCKSDNLSIRKWAFAAVKEQRQREARTGKRAEPEPEPEIWGKVCE